MVSFDWTPVLTMVIVAVSTILGVFVKYVWTYNVKPWLDERGLEKAAVSVVYAVEAILGRYCGEEKWQAALEKMALRGYNIDAEEVIDALKAAWKELDLKQIIAGEKEAKIPEKSDTE